MLRRRRMRTNTHFLIALDWPIHVAVTLNAHWTAPWPSQSQNCAGLISSLQWGISRRSQTLDASRVNFEPLRTKHVNFGQSHRGIMNLLKPFLKLKKVGDVPRFMPSRGLRGDTINLKTKWGCLDNRFYAFNFRLIHPQSSSEITIWRLTPPPLANITHLLEHAIFTMRDNILTLCYVCNRVSVANHLHFPPETSVSC